MLILLSCLLDSVVPLLRMTVLRMTVSANLMEAPI